MLKSTLPSHYSIKNYRYCTVGGPLWIPVAVSSENVRWKVTQTSIVRATEFLSCISVYLSQYCPRKSDRKFGTFAKKWCTGEITPQVPNVRFTSREHPYTPNVKEFSPQLHGPRYNKKIFICAAMNNFFRIFHLCLFGYLHVTISQHSCNFWDTHMQYIKAKDLIRTYTNYEK